MSFYSILFVHLKVLMKSKLHTLPSIVMRSRSMNRSCFYKIIEVNKNERITSSFITKDGLLNWFVDRYGVKKVKSKAIIANWVKLLKITQLKRKIFFNESPKIKGKTKNKTLPKKKK